MKGDLLFYVLAGEQQALDDSVRAIAAAHVRGIVGERAGNAETLARRALYWLAVTDRAALSRLLGEFAAFAQPTPHMG